MPSGSRAREAAARVASALCRSHDARSMARQSLREPDGDKQAGICVLPERWGEGVSRLLTTIPPHPPASPERGRNGPAGSPADFPPLWVSTGCRGLAAASPGCPRGPWPDRGASGGEPALSLISQNDLPSLARVVPQRPCPISAVPLGSRFPPAGAPVRLFASCLAAANPHPPNPFTPAAALFSSPSASACRPVGGRPIPLSAQSRTASVPSSPSLVLLACYWKRLDNGASPSVLVSQPSEYVVVSEKWLSD